jgi:hypothetical protein
MSQDNVLKFFLAVRDSTAVLVRYDGRNLAELLFHAKNDGFDFTATELADAVGRLEGSVIVNKDRDPYDGSARLWRSMWGHRHLEYLIESVVRRHTDSELCSLITQDGAAAT